jgi:hypothetical protein
MTINYQQEQLIAEFAAKLVLTKSVGDIFPQPPGGEAGLREPRRPQPDYTSGAIGLMVAIKVQA